jgi:hypothetical protein
LRKLRDSTKIKQNTIIELGSLIFTVDSNCPTISVRHEGPGGIFMLIGHRKRGIWITPPMFVVGAHSGAVPWKRAGSPTEGCRPQAPCAGGFDWAGYRHVVGMSQVRRPPDTQPSACGFPQFLLPTDVDQKKERRLGPRNGGLLPVAKDCTEHTQLSTPSVFRWRLGS